jgi:hypothetical protein
MVDRRLLGTWRSDKRRTSAELRPWLEQRAQRAQLFARILGRLTFRYTPTRIHESGIGQPSSRAYKVVAKDAESVVIETFDALLGRTHLVHIHFEDGRYWLSAGAVREWFKRVA